MQPTPPEPPLTVALTLWPSQTAARFGLFVFNVGPLGCALMVTLWFWPPALLQPPSVITQLNCTVPDPPDVKEMLEPVVLPSIEPPVIVQAKVAPPGSTTDAERPEELAHTAAGAVIV